MVTGEKQVARPILRARHSAVRALRSPRDSYHISAHARFFAGTSRAEPCSAVSIAHLEYWKVTLPRMSLVVALMLALRAIAAPKMFALPFDFVNWSRTMIMPYQSKLPLT